MIFKSIYIKQGLFERKIDFSNDVNLIYSEKNSRGKTTLLRFMLYALGYNVPSTKKIKFSQCEVEMIIESEKNGEIKLCRNDVNSINTEASGCISTFVLPEQQKDLQKLFFDTSNHNIINNLLGTFYVDQEKGWTLLNRGVVIGRIHFNIEELIRGLAGIDCLHLIEKEAKLTRELSKYKQVFSVSKYREMLQNEEGEIATLTYDEVVNTELDQLLIKQREIKAELRRIDSTLLDNKRFKKFVTDMKLLVSTHDGEFIHVTEDNIVGLNDAIDLLIRKRKEVSIKLNDMNGKIEKLQKERDKEYEQLEFVKTASQLELFDKNISRMQLNQVTIKQEISRLQKIVTSLREEISKITKENNSVTVDIADTMVKYATELGLGDKDSIPQNYLFTSNLKELSGALLHKTAFAFRLSYIVAIEKHLNIKLPIILDSPSGKEVDKENIKLMMDILERDFSEHQIIIASIFEYDLGNINKVEIKERLLEMPI